MPGIKWDLYVGGEQRVTSAFHSIARAQDSAGKGSVALTKSWGALKTAGALAAKASLGVGGALLGAGAAAVAMTDDVIGLNLQVAKAKVVFGASFAAVDKQLSKTASAFGITRIEALGLAGTFADTAKQQGFATAEAAKMSLKFVDLAGRVKLLSAGKLDSAAASEALSAAFRGEFDTLQQVVPAISAARVEELALNIQKHSSRKLTEDQAKTLAVLQIVQGGVSTSNALLQSSEGKKALAIERARTKMREQWQTLQQNLLPALSSLWSTVGDKVNPALEDFTAYLQSPQGKKAVEDWTGAISGAVGALLDLVGATDDVMNITQQATIYARKAWLQVGKAVVDMKVSIYESLSDLPGGLGKPFEEGAARARKAADRIQQRIDDLDTKAARLETDRLQSKIDSLRGKTVRAGVSKAEKDAAVRQIADLQNRINKLQGRSVRITATAVYYGDGSVRRINSNGTLGPIMRARGGSVHGPGTRISDSIDARLSNDEHVVSAAEVRGAGGHARLNEMRSAWRSGRPGFASGGAVIDKVDRSIDNFTHRIVDRLAKRLDLLGGANVRGWSAQWAALHAAFPGAQLFSSFRPGAITATGNQSYHALGRAIDVTPSMAIFNWIRQRYGKNIAELIYSPAGGGQIKNGRPHFYGEPTRGDHWDHVHWAMDAGGVATGPGSFRKLTGRPERVLSPAQTASFDRLVGVLGAQGGAPRVENHYHFPRYLGSRDDLRRDLQQMVGRGDLDFLTRRTV
jgi:hypothetical protein